MNEKWLKAAAKRFRAGCLADPDLSDAQIVVGLRAVLDPREAESAHESAHKAVDEIGFDEIAELWGFLKLGRVYAASVCLSVDDSGEPDETEAQLFLAEDEAAKAWPESVAAAREAAQYEKEKSDGMA